MYIIYSFEKCFLALNLRFTGLESETTPHPHPHTHIRDLLFPIAPYGKIGVG